MDRFRFKFLVLVFVSSWAQVWANPLAMPVVGAHKLKVISPTALELSLVTTKNPDPAGVADWDFVVNGVLTAPAVSEFVVEENGAARVVSSVGFKRRVLYAPLKARDLRIGNSIYLTLATPLADG